MNIFKKNDIAVLIVPANLHDTLPGMMEKFKGKAYGYIYKVYDLHIGVAVKVLDFKDGYYEVECPLIDGSPTGWIKRIAIEGDGDHKLQPDIMLSNNHIKNYYKSIIDILAIKQAHILDTINTSQTERIGTIVLREGAKEAFSAMGKLIPLPGASTAFSAAADALLPQTKSKIKLEYSEQLKGRKQHIAFSLYSKMMHLIKKDKEGQGTLYSLDECVSDTFDALNYSMHQRKEMHPDTIEEVLTYFEGKFGELANK